MAAKKVSQKKATKNPLKKKSASPKIGVKKIEPVQGLALKPCVGTESPIVDMQDEITSPEETEITKSPSINSKCKCIQKRANGNFFCFRLVQGRWIQSSAIPFPTQELCEEANCDN
jgi:hypothetical protein